LELNECNQAPKRRLRLVRAQWKGSAETAREIRERLTAITRHVMTAWAIAQGRLLGADVRMEWWTWSAMATDQRLRQWYRGLILMGDLAEQYEIEPCNPATDPQPVIPRQRELWLDQIAPITIFVGANNSGKSRLLRGIFGDLRLIDWFRIEPPAEGRHQAKFARLLKSLASSLDGELDIAQVRDLRQQSRRISTLIPDGWLYRPLLEELDRRASPYETLTDFEADPRISSGEELGPREYQIREYLKETEAGSLRKQFSTYMESARYYIPMLRGMRPLSPAISAQDQEDDGRDAYELRTYQDYFSHAGWPTDDAGPEPSKTGAGYQKHPRIFTGLGIYADMQRRLLSPIQAERDSIRTYEQFLSEQFFSGLPVTLTPALHKLDGSGKRTGNDVVYLKIGDSKDHPIYDLGDGMQSLIVCTYPIITELNDGSLFFLEEPDLCMHPSLQRIFINVLRDYHRKKSHQFFLTTHSNHLLDLLEDDQLVSIFSFSRVETVELPSPVGAATPADETVQAMDRFRIRHASQRDRAILLELGVRPSATYLANATIWVEGTSDCSYLRAYMEALIAYLELRGNDAYKAVAKRLRRYKEDRHFAFLEYNGANLVHFNFEEEGSSDSGPGSPSRINAAYLCAQALVIADGDIAGKADRVKVFTGQLGDRFVVLPVKEIENLIPEAALRLQVESDRSRKKNQVTTHWPENYDGLIYANYSARKGGSCVNATHGLGYGLERCGFFGYKAGSGTLKPEDKKRWACQVNGIPMRLRRMIREYQAGDTGEGAQESPQLPPYLNQDLIWLCLVIFCHIAKHNHDTVIETHLNQLKDWIQSEHEPKPLPAAMPAWPIPNPSKDDPRPCLLTQFVTNDQVS
jgi:hypothetical protein